MKRLLALLLVVVMLFAVLALASCGNQNEETTSTTKPAETTATTPAATTATTPAATTATTPAATTATTPAATTATTPAATTATTPAPTTPPTTPPVETSETTGTTMEIFARFDFGTKTKAEAKELTSHQYLKDAMSYNSNYVQVEYTEDTIIIYAARDYTSAVTDRWAYALRFDDIVTYDFDGELAVGYGSWNGAPYSTARVGQSGQWHGRTHYVKIRIKNPTENNMWSFDYAWVGGNYATTMVCSNLYMQGGVPQDAKDTRLTAKPTDKFETYTYDIMFTNALASGKCTVNTFFEYVQQVKNTGSIPGNNWSWNAGGTKVGGLRFHFLGACCVYSSNLTKNCDTRANIKQGNHVEVDYVVFGASPEQLATWTSYAEDAGK